MPNSAHPWNITVAVIFGVFASLPPAVEAQVFKCQQPDGSTSFQALPCPNSTKVPATPAADRSVPPVPAAPEPYYDPYAPENAGQRALPPLPPAAREAAASRMERPAVAETKARTEGDVLRLRKEQQIQREAGRSLEHDAERARAIQEIDQQNKRNQAYNKMQRCNFARDQLGLLMEQGKVYWRDNSGDRRYVADENRQAAIAAAERRVAAECN